MTKQEKTIALAIGWILYIISAYLLYPVLGWKGILGLFIFTIAHEFMKALSHTREL